MKTRAAVCRAFGKPLTVETVELAEPNAGEVLIKTAACAICHSDIFYIDGAWGGELPAVYGHEAAGVVEAVGAGVTRLKAGDHVVATLIRNCGFCPACAEGAPVFCEEVFPLDRLDSAARRRRQAARPRPAHRRLRRAHRRRPVAGGRDPEGRAARQRVAHRLRRADGDGRGRQHRRRQGGLERRRHRLRRRRPQFHPGRPARRRFPDHRRRHRARQARRRARIRRDRDDQRQKRGRRRAGQRR